MGDFVDADTNVFLLNCMEVARLGQPCEPVLERTLVKLVTFPQADTASHIAIAEFVQTNKIDASHEVGRLVAKSDALAHQVRFSIQSPRCFNASLGSGLFARVLWLNTRYPSMPQIFERLRRIRRVSLCLRVRQEFPAVLSARRS